MALVDRFKYSSATKGLGSLILVTLQGLCLAEEKTRNSSEATLVVTTHLSPPYIMFTQNARNLTGNDRFEGYCVDLLKEVSKIAGFNFTIYQAKSYGHFDNQTRTWKGMIGELVSGRADIAVADLTITHKRTEVVDFTVSFMNTGISILYIKPQEKDPDLFTFLNPLSPTVWLCIISAYILVSISLCLLAKINHFPNRSEDMSLEGEDMGPRNQKRSVTSKVSQAWRNISTDDEETPERKFTLKNSLWFGIASLLQQGGDIPIRNLSTRLVVGLWWFFTLIIISSYTANLAAHLTVKRMESPIRDAHDLSKQYDIKYGCVKKGATWQFFQNSKIPVYNQMMHGMTLNKDNFQPNNQMGVDRVIRENGKYAYIMESMSVEYVTVRNCNLTQIGERLNDRNYGFALPRNSPYRAKINQAILKLQENGKLQLLKKKWWNDRYTGPSCNKQVPGAKAESLDIKSIAGIFVLLVMGLVLALVIAIAERLLYGFT